MSLRWVQFFSPAPTEVYLRSGKPAEAGRKPSPSSAKALGSLSKFGKHFKQLVLESDRATGISERFFEAIFRIWDPL